MTTHILAHRGFSGRYPENSMRAFREAVTCGSHGVEFDVQRTRDGELVVIHDERLDYSTTGAGWVHEQSWAELKTVKLRSRTSDMIFSDTIPHLDEVLGFLAEHKLVINCELKNGLLPFPGMEEQVLAAVHARGVQESVIISSFNHGSMLRVKELDSSIKTGIIYAGRPVDLWNYAGSLRVDALHPDRGFIDAEFVRAARREGFMVNTYTVNDPLEIQRILETGVDGIITNYPDRVRQAAV